MNLVIPAEASTDVLKAAYVYYRQFNMRLTNIEIAYPNKPFRMFDSDIVIGVHVDAGPLNVTRISGYRDAMGRLNNPAEMRFLEHVPDQMSMCFHNPEKTLLIHEVFKAFEAYDRNIREAISVTAMLEDRTSLQAGGWNIVVAPKDKFLTPDERILLFRSASIHYIVFASGNTVGVQKCVSRKCPLLTTFAEKMGLTANPAWFSHRRGHLVTSKADCAPPLAVEELAELLQTYLQNVAQ